MTKQAGSTQSTDQLEIDTGISRRTLIAGVGSAFLLSGIHGGALGKQSRRPERWVSACSDNKGNYALGWVSANGQSAHSTMTNFRGHSVLQHGTRPNSIVFIARRPGTRVVEINLSSGDILRSFDCGEHRHLFGHGCFSANGHILYTTEADLKSGEGRIVARDADSYTILADWPSGGVGPHEIRMLPGQKTLVVANGGILTHPRSGRKPLNLDSMDSNLAYIDSENGHLLGTFRVEEQKSSIRHIDVAADGTVAFAIQLQRKATHPTKHVPLTGVHRPGESLSVLKQPQTLIDRLSDYVGSTAICEETRIAGYASPRGNLALFWNIDSEEFIGYHQLRDVCGLAVSHQHKAFILSNSLGAIRELDHSSLAERRAKRRQIERVRWDNHLLITKSV